MTNRAIIIVCALLLAIASWVGYASGEATMRRDMKVLDSQELDPKCWEDEPCWDCETMGNQICGPEQ